MMGAIILSLVLFLVVREVGNFLVWRYYLDEQTREERADEYIEKLNQYIFENKLSINDTEKISEWTSGKYIDVILYKDTNLIYAPDWFKDYEENGENESELSADFENDTETEPSSDTQTEAKIPEDYFIYNDSWFSGDRGFEQYLTEEAREKYQTALQAILDGNEELKPIYCVDGTLLATVVDYSEDLVYNLVSAFAIVCALVFVALIMVFNLTRLSGRVTRLAEKVKAVEEGRHDMAIALDGDDEIASLASDVNSMRNTIVENMTKERRAWEANTGLITAMSHDIRTPLTVLLGYLDLIELQNTDSTNQEYINVCKENALRLKHLSDDLFSYFFVFGKNGVSLNISESPAYETIENMIAEHSLLLSEQEYKLVIQTKLELYSVSMDNVYFGRVIGNIFSNMKKYADIDKEIYISSSFDGERLSISFENSVRKRENASESTGIGLKTCRKIMQEMGGEFVAEEIDGKFVTVVSLPAKLMKE